MTRLLLPLLLLLPIIGRGETAPWVDSTFYCLGDNCCMKGKAKVGKTCVLAQGYSVPTPDGKDMGVIHYQMRWYSENARYFTMADEKGRELFVDTSGEVVAVSTEGMLVCFGRKWGSASCEYRVRGKKKIELHQTNQFLLGGYPLYVTEIHDAAGNKTGLAPLRIDGTLGPTFPGASFAGSFVLGEVAVFRVADSTTGVSGSVMVDVAGNVVWSGQELRQYGTPHFGNVTLMAVGESPFDLDAEDHNVYVPLGKDDRPLKLPESILGIIPAPLVKPLDLGASTRDLPRIAFGFMVVEKAKAHRFDYTTGLGIDPQDTLNSSASSMDFDAVRAVRMGGPDSNQIFLTAHSNRNGLWFAYGDSPVAGKGKTPEEAGASAIKGIVDKYNEVELVRKQNEAKRNATYNGYGHDYAWEAMQMAGSRKSFWEKFIPEMDKACVNPDRLSSHCREVEEAAYGLGEPYATQFLSHQDGFYFTGRPDEACRIGKSACEQAMRIDGLNQDRAEEKRLARARFMAAWQEQVDRSKQGPDVKVNYYEGGRLQQKTMSFDQYHNVYGR